MNYDTIVDALPEGYRWATPTEHFRRSHPAYYNKVVQVKFEFLGETWTDLAIKA